MTASDEAQDDGSSEDSATQKKAAKKKASKKKATKKKATKKKATKKKATKKKATKKKAAKEKEVVESEDPPREDEAPLGEPKPAFGISDDEDVSSEEDATLTDDDLELDLEELDVEAVEDGDLPADAPGGLLDPLIASSDDVEEPDEDAEAPAPTADLVEDPSEERAPLSSVAANAAAAQAKPATGEPQAEAEQPRRSRRRPNTLLPPEVAARRLMDKPNVVNALNWMRVAEGTPPEILRKMYNKLEAHVWFKEKDPNVKIDLERAVRRAEKLLDIQY